tara:strand:- start:118 stop:384 length:267 start_codon:yes stop_codon:yes gene_type:complete
MTKKLWLLEPRNRRAELWDPWYDKAFGFVVCAETEEKARMIAQLNGGTEVGFEARKDPAWTDPTQSTCRELTAESEEIGLILRDFASA